MLYSFNFSICERKQDNRGYRFVVRSIFRIIARDEITFISSLLENKEITELIFDEIRNEEIKELSDMYTIDPYSLYQAILFDCEGCENPGFDNRGNPYKSIVFDGWGDVSKDEQKEMGKEGFLLFANNLFSKRKEEEGSVLSPLERAKQNKLFELNIGRSIAQFTI